MTTFGLRRGQWLKAVVGAALVLAMVPAQGRCDSYSIYCMLIELATPQKPQHHCCNHNDCCNDDDCVGQDDGCTHSPCCHQVPEWRQAPAAEPACIISPCCPQGACTGARTMPCCPKPCTACDKACVSGITPAGTVTPDVGVTCCPKSCDAGDWSNSKIFELSYSKIFEAYLNALTDNGFEILEANAYEGRILAENSEHKVVKIRLKPTMTGGVCSVADLAIPIENQPCAGCDKKCCENCESCPVCQKNAKENCDHCNAAQENNGCGSACPLCRGNKPEHSEATAGCQATLEKQAHELRRLCGEHQRTIYELEAIVMDLCQEISLLRQDIQSIRHEERSRFVFLHDERLRFAPPYNMAQPEESFPLLPPNAGYFMPPRQFRWPGSPTPWVVYPQPVPATSLPVRGIED
jgi:hypothetical protein